MTSLSEMSGRWRLVGAALTLAAFLLLAVELASQVAFAQIQPRIQQDALEAFGAEIQWGHMAVTPLPLGGIVLYDVDVSAPTVTTGRLQIRRLLAQYHLIDLVRRRWSSVQELKLVEPKLALGAKDVTVSKAVQVKPETTPLRGGPVRLVVQDAEVSTPEGARLFDGVSATALWQDEEVVLHQAHLNLLGMDIGARGVVMISRDEPKWNMKVQFSRPGLSGEVEVTDSETGSSVEGQVKSKDAQALPISSHLTLSRGRIEAEKIQVGVFQAVSGMIDLGNQSWSVVLEGPEGGLVELKGQAFDWRRPSTDVIFRDLKVGPMSVSTAARLKGKWGVSGLTGTVETVGTTVNGQSVEELTGEWTLSKEQLSVRSAHWSDYLFLEGNIGLESPYPMRWAAKIHSVDVGDVARRIEPGKAPIATGTLSGHVEIVGPIGQTNTKGYIIGSDGIMGGKPYETGILNFEGDGSRVQFSDSRFRYGEHVIIVEGSMDVAYLGTQDVFRDVKMIPLDQTGEEEETAAIFDEAKAPEPSRVRLESDSKRTILGELPVEPEEAAEPTERKETFVGVKREVQF